MALAGSYIKENYIQLIFVSKIVKLPYPRDNGPNRPLSQKKCRW